MSHVYQTCRGDESFKCPRCGAYLRIEWSTEYGDPVVGEEDFKCPACGASTRIQTSIVYKIIN
jgi:uncharacterized C2H2 Zn-finger protein